MVHLPHNGRLTAIRFFIIALLMLLAAPAALHAQYARHAPTGEDVATILSEATRTSDFWSAATGSVVSEELMATSIENGLSLDEAEALKRKGRALLITGGALGITGAALYGSSFTMVSDSTSIGGVFSVGGIMIFASAISYCIIGTSKYVKGKKAILSAQAGTIALNF